MVDLPSRQRTHGGLDNHHTGTRPNSMGHLGSLLTCRHLTYRMEDLSDHPTSCRIAICVGELGSRLTSRRIRFAICAGDMGSRLTSCQMRIPSTMGNLSSHLTSHRMPNMVKGLGSHLTNRLTNSHNPSKMAYLCNRVRDC